LHAAGTVGIFSDIVMAVGVLLIAFELVQRERAVAAGGWIAMFLSIVVFTFVDAIGGYVLAPLAGLNDGAGVFAGFKRLFDVFFCWERSRSAAVPWWRWPMKCAPRRRPSVDR
jgi:hypothetical protein